MSGQSASDQPKTPTRGLWLTLLLVFAMYVPSVGNAFAVDAALLAKPTFRNGAEQPLISTLHSPAFYFTQHFWAGNETYDALYRPVPIYSFALTHHLLSKPSFSAKNHAVPHHIIDLLLHLLAVVLVWRFVLSLKISPPVAVMTALLFGAHAIHHEVVVSIVGRTELLAFTCGLGALLLFGRNTKGSLVASSVLLLVAFCSKESALAWVAFLPCFQLARGWLIGDTRSWLLKYAIVVVPALLIWFLLRNNALADMSHIPREIDNLKNPLAHVDTTTRLLTAIKIWGYGLYKCLVPYPLSFLYGVGTFSIVTSPSDPGFLASTVALLTILITGLVFAKRLPLLFLGMALLLGFSFTASNVPVVAGTIFGERLYYTPSLGLCLIVALLLIQFAKQAKPMRIGLGIYVALNVAIVLPRNNLWDEDEPLLFSDVQVQPGSANMHHDIAAILYNRKPPEKVAAVASVHTALAIYPEYPQALLKLASFHGGRRETQEAKHWYVRACHSPFSHIGLRLKVQRALEGIQHPSGIASATMRQLQDALQTDADIAATWVSFVNRAMTTGNFPVNSLRMALDESKRRFPHDQLLAIYRGLFASRDGVQDATEARVILDEFEPALWRLLAEQRVMPMFVHARIAAATCYATLSDWSAVEHILDAMIDDLDMPGGFRTTVENAKKQLLAARR